MLQSRPASAKRSGACGQPWFASCKPPLLLLYSVWVGSPICSTGGRQQQRRQLQQSTKGGSKQSLLPCGIQNKRPDASGSDRHFITDMSSPTWDCSANKKAISPATSQMTELWAYSVFHAARLNIFVYSSRYPWHGFHTGEGKALPSSCLHKDS